MSKKVDNFLIERSARPIIFQSMIIVLMSYSLLLFSLLLIVGIRRILGIDATLIGIGIVLFGVFSFFTASALYKLMDAWLRVSYFVSNNQLFLKSDSKHISSSTRSLGDITKVSADHAYRFFRPQDYGNVTIHFARGGSEEILTLKDVYKPSKIAKKLSENITT